MYFHLDRTAFRIQTFAEAGNTVAYWRSRPAQERLAAAWYLTCCAYILPYHSGHRLDKSAFSMRKLA